MESAVWCEPSEIASCLRRGRATAQTIQSVQHQIQEVEIAPPHADLNDPLLLDKALEAGIVQGARRALTLSTSDL